MKGVASIALVLALLGAVGVAADGKTYPVYDVEISSESHPFYTGKQRIMDAAGRVERFNERYKNFG